jgi:hypothetical protein
MPDKLRFMVTPDFVKIVQHARNAKEHIPTYADAYVPAYHRGGKVKEKDGSPDPENLDLSKIPPMINLVHDSGVYLMSNGAPRLLADPDSKSTTSLVVQALHCDPKKDPNWWDTSRDLVGGDDFVESLDIELFEKAIALGLPYVEIEVTEEQILIELPAPSPKKSPSPTRAPKI